MPRWNVIQRVDYYAGGIEADTEDEARSIYLADQDRYYDGVVSERVEEIEWCDSCDKEFSWRTCSDHYHDEEEER
jgi:hypothetical protein